MDAVSQRTRSKRLQETQETQETQHKAIYEAQHIETRDTEETTETTNTANTANAMEITQAQWDYGVRDSMDDRMDNYVSAMLYTAIHYPRLFAAIWILVFVALSVLAASTQKRSV